MMMMNAVTDIAGLNRISKQVLSNAAHAAAGMARGYEVDQVRRPRPASRSIAISMFGVTTPGVMRIREQLEENGFEVVTFHAVGEGAGMEHLIDTGAIDGAHRLHAARDHQPLEQGHLRPGLRADGGRDPHGHPAGRRPGCGRVLQLRRRATPSRRSSTPTSATSSSTTRTSPRCWRPRTSCARLGEYIADHVNQAPGPKAVALPLNGLDNYFKEGSQWHGVDVSPLLDAIRATLDPAIEVVEMDNNINDTAFADAVFDAVHASSGRRRRHARGGGQRLVTQRLFLLRAQRGRARPQGRRGRPSRRRGCSSPPTSAGVSASGRTVPSGSSAGRRGGPSRPPRRWPGARGRPAPR